MLCRYDKELVEFNESREKEGLPPVSRRQFCKYVAVSSLALSLPLSMPRKSDALTSCGADVNYIKRTLNDSRAEIKVIPGLALDDYSGPFRQNLRFTDFSKIGLSRLHQMASEYHNAIMAAYRGYLIERHGESVFAKMETTVWGSTMVPLVHTMIRRTMKIKGSTVQDFMKQWQVELNSLPSVYNDAVFEMPTKRRGIVTINRCGLALQLEETGRIDLLSDLCSNRCPKAFQNAAKEFSSAIKVKNLTKPPRLDDDHVCCKWEVYYRIDGSKCTEEPNLPIDVQKMDRRGELTLSSGVNLVDYSGPFRPDLRITDFSRELLARMFLMYHKYDLDMIMNYQVMEIIQSGGDYAAGADMQTVVWSHQLAEAARSIMMKYLNTPGSGIDSFLKAVQVDITAQPPSFDNSFEMPDEKTGIYTFNKCWGITIMETVGGTVEQIQKTCELDPAAIGNSCVMYSRGLVGKKIHLDIIKLPPRQCRDEICCQWKFTYVNA